MIPGQTLTKTGGTGAFGGTTTITSVDSSSQITITSTTANTAGSIIFSVGGATDVTANGGGITLKGATDKTFNWVSSTGAWTSSESLNLASGKVYEINGTPVLSSTQVLGKTIGGTATGDIVSIDSQQTLTNKSLTSPTLTGTAKIGSSTSRTYYLPSFDTNYVPGIQGIGNSYASPAWMSLAQWSTSTTSSGGAFISLNKSNGVEGTQTIVANGQRVGGIGFAGSDGAKFLGVADIYGEVDASPALNSMPGRLVFATTADGFTTPSERMRITRQGRVGIWTTNPSTALDVNGTVTATSFSGPLTGNVTGNVTGIASGNIKQGGGTSQTTNTIYMGWSASSKLRVQVDSTDFGSNWPIDISGTAAKVADGAVTQASTSNMLVPAGAVMAFAMNSAPTGWLACNGQAVDRSGPSGYPTLFAAIGTTYGVGNNSTTFNLPNLQGIFVRGSGSQTVGGVSYSRTHATTQNDALQNISGTVGQFDAAFGTTVATGAFTTTQVTRTTGGGGSGKYLTADFDASRVARADVETRPVNIAMLYCIKI